MYSIERKQLAVNTYYELHSLRKTIRILGYPARRTLESWINEYKTYGRLNDSYSKRKSRYLDFVINYIIVKMEAGEGIVDIYDIIEETRIDNEIHHSILKEKKNEATTIDNYKELLFGPSDNVLQYYVNHDVSCAS